MDAFTPSLGIWAFCIAGRVSDGGICGECGGEVDGASACFLDCMFGDAGDKGTAVDVGTGYFTVWLKEFSAEAVVIVGLAEDDRLCWQDIGQQCGD